jgi:hypothetical protein
MHMCIHIFTYTFMIIWRKIHIYSYIYIYICRHVLTHIDIYTRKRINIYILHTYLHRTIMPAPQYYILQFYLVRNLRANLYLYIYVYIYICIYIYMCIWQHTLMYIQTYFILKLWFLGQSCRPPSIISDKSEISYTYEHTCCYAYIHIYVHTYTLIYIYTYTHIYMPAAQLYIFPDY